MGRPDTRQARIAILVLGMHRSGTSALTRLIGHLGAALPADAIEAHADNARGYWESAAIVKAGDQLLRAARSSWFDPRPLDLSRLEPSALRSRKDRLWEAVVAAFGDAPLIAIKDPRQCRFVPTVVETLAEHGVASRAVLMLRNPDAIARSVARRDGTTPAYAQLLWLRHMIDAERATRGLQRAVIDYDAMLADWSDAVARLLPLTGAAMPEGRPRRRSALSRSVAASPWRGRDVGGRGAAGIDRRRRTRGDGRARGPRRRGRASGARRSLCRAGGVALARR
ncbi:sulfotransferase family protein [Rhizorhabdus histidinilytica]